MSKIKQKKEVVGILGVGEVGTAIKQACQKKYQVLTKDLGEDKLKDKKIEIFHVCIPYVSWRQFSVPVLSQIKKSQPKLVIINSTVAPGTARRIQENSGVPTVHAPIMGVHPNLYKYLFVFPKFIGPVTKRGGDLAEEHFKKLGLKVEWFKKAEETELAKIMSTTYYGLAIIFCKWLKKHCDQEGLDFENIYTRFNQAYNEGYQADLPHVHRPVLKPQPGKIGGHCVVPNAMILKKLIRDPFSRLVLKLDKTFGLKKDAA